MKKMLLAAVGLTALLASCDLGGSTPSGSSRVIGVETEYVTGTNPTSTYVGCDNVSGGTNAARAKSTQVVVVFAAAGEITDITIRLLDAEGNASADFTRKDIKPTDLKKDAAGNYRVFFDANSATGKLLPASIVVSPTELPEKLVTVANKVPGGFYAELDVNTTTGPIYLSSRILGIVPVYSNCTLQGAQPLSQ